jgi:4-amino-4-deoxy-L-arabinose transferase-like glycosyltransferase
MMDAEMDYRTNAEPKGMKRTGKTLTDLLLEKPVLSVFLLAVLLTLPWIFFGDFYTKGEPREACAVLSILNDGHWIVPVGYADEIGYKPPLLHWIIAGISLLNGSVSEWTCRLPSALGLIGLTLLTLVFLKKRKSSMEAVLSALILFTSFEMHRSGLECRVDMTLAFFMASALFGLYRWEEKGLKGFPVLTVFLLACACFVKGPVGAVLPCLIFGVYLLLRGYGFGKALWKNVLVVVPALLPLGVWYVLAWKDQGDYFLKVAFAENIGRFLGMSRESLGIDYYLGHRAPFWFYLPALFTGLLPWSLLPLLAVFFFGWKKWGANLKRNASSWWNRFRNMDKFTLFSLLVVVLFILFYSIPSSKRSVYILPLYPFAAYLLTRVFLWTERVRPALFKVFSYGFMGLSVLLILVFGTAFFVDLSALSAPFVTDARTAHDIGLFAVAFRNPGFWTVFFGLLLLLITGLFAWKLRLKNNRMAIFGIFAVYMSMQVFLEAAVYPVYKDGYSSRAFAEKIEKTYDLEHHGYVMNRLRDIRNLYGLNFYLGHPFKNFDTERPTQGFLVIGEKGLKKVRATYAGKYRFKELERSEPYNELNDEIVVCQIFAL